MSEDYERYEAQLEEAAARGARRALKEIGLEDENAASDIRAIRGWLDGYRFVKHTFTRTTASIFTVAFWALLIGGLISWIASHLGGK